MLAKPLLIEESPRMKAIEEFLREHKIEEVECLVPDMAGIARGKILPAGSS